VSDKWLSLLHALTGRLLEERPLRHDPGPLLEEFTAAGFEAGEVELGLAWVERFLEGVDGPREEAGGPFTSSGCRTRTAEEMLCVTTSAFGYLLRLESSGVIDAAIREEILERALAAGEPEVGEEEMREISRSVLEAQGRDGSAAGPTAGDAAARRRRHN